MVRLALGALCVAIGLGGVPAGATPSAPGATAPAAEQVEVAAEQYNLARLNVDRARAAFENTEHRIKAAEASTKLIQIRVRARARALYTGVGTTSPFPIEPGTRLSERDRRTTYLNAAQRPDEHMVTVLSQELARLRTARESQQAARGLLERNLAAARQTKQRLATMAAQAAAASAPRSDDGAGPIGSPASPGPAPATAPVTVKAPPSPRPTSTTTTPRPVPVSTPPPPPAPVPTPTPPPPPATSPGPPSSPGAGNAVAFARAQLGKPYAFATSGPATFDCSGLTMAAWAAAGVRMPHYSGSQATMFTKVSYAQLQPGDIVVFYGDLHHVGLYIGGGMMIHAPQTGDVVKIAPAWRTTFQWGVRPR